MRTLVPASSSWAEPITLVYCSISITLKAISTAAIRKKWWNTQLKKCMLRERWVTPETSDSGERRVTLETGDSGERRVTLESGDSGETWVRWQWREMGDIGDRWQWREMGVMTVEKWYWRETWQLNGERQVTLESSRVTLHLTDQARIWDNLMATQAQGVTFIAHHFKKSAIWFNSQRS